SNPLIRRLPLILVLAGLLILLSWIGIVTYRIYNLSQTLGKLQNLSQTLSAESIYDVDIEYIESLAIDARRDLVGLRESTEPLYGLMPYLAWVPEIGPLLSSLPEMMVMADSGSAAAVELLDGLKPVILLLQEDSGANPESISQLLDAVSGAKQSINTAIPFVETMIEAREEIENADELPWRVNSILETFDKEIPLLEDGLRLATVLPEMMGTNGRHSYLIMAQNEDELRPTGGFVSGAGLLVVEDGQIVSVEFTDASLVDDWINKPYDFPPQPFYEIMGMDIFLFRDVNFWPDFPMTALEAMDLYSHGQDVPVDGVIAIDQEFLRLILSATGPLFVPEIERTVASENVVSEMRAQWSPDPGGEGNWVDQRKAFMGPMANALRQRLESDLKSLNPINLVRSLQSAADQRHLQIYMRDPIIAEVLAQTGWDGHFENSAGQDYLLVVDTSMGFNKVSAVVEREISYHVSIPEEGRPEVSLQIQYTHTGHPSEVECYHGVVYTNLMTYSDLQEDCYWNYVRVYAPQGSVLLGSNHNPVPAANLLSGQPWKGLARVAEEGNAKFEVFDNFYLVEQGQQFVGEIKYSLPESVRLAGEDGHVYRLQVARQAGAKPHPVYVLVTIPEGAEFIDASPPPVSIDGNDIVFSEILTNDLSFIVYYR
ncbi:MAG TPA: DUF4012 domain-containing protein, partial [candidate division Zixibacteria bacterium]|nr:DUF4012 domain-containing protein [candidate division Zixibacteria bacterium]